MLAKEMEISKARVRSPELEQMNLLSIGKDKEIARLHTELEQKEEALASRENEIRRLKEQNRMLETDMSDFRSFMEQRASDRNLQY
jgi:uncharacterized protein (DUF3084 family)